MISDETRSVIERSKHLFEQHREMLESEHNDRYVAIEPESGELFLADTFDDAVKTARIKDPTRLSHTIRIGHEAAFHIGRMER